RDRGRHRPPPAGARRPAGLGRAVPVRRPALARAVPAPGTVAVGRALRGLTTRGRSFLAAAGAAALSAVVLGEKDLLRVAVLLAVLPLLAVAYVGRNRYRLACVRTCEPRRVPVGATARVRLKLQNLSRLVTGTLLLEDRLPYALGTRPRLVLERLGGMQASSVTYTVRTELRGVDD